MARMSLKKERWTITFDPILKNRVEKEAKKLRVYPVQLLESLVRQHMSPYGFQDICFSVHYVNKIREQSAGRSDKDFLSDLRKWQRN